MEKKENLVYGGSEPLLKDYPEEYKRFTKERLTKGVEAKIIVEESEWGQQEQKTAQAQLRELKFLPPGKKFKANTPALSSFVRFFIAKRLFALKISSSIFNLWGMIILVSLLFTSIIS